MRNRATRSAARLCIVVVAVSATIIISTSASADPAQQSDSVSLPHRDVPAFVLPSDSTKDAGEPSTTSAHATESDTVTDTPGNVYQVDPAVLVNAPESDPADLISASATDDGTNLTFTAKTVALDNPLTDPNWRNNTYIGWGIDSTFSGDPEYFVYFALNSDGSYAGELDYFVTGNPVSCTVTLSFNTTVGYQAVVPTSCLPGVTTFQWLAYTLYDKFPLAQDPDGNQAFGKVLPDFHDNGDVQFAAPVTAPPTTSASQVTNGYWLFARDGGVFTFGGSSFYGSEGGTRLNQPIVGGATTPDGQGYWLVAADGGVFTFGDARFYGSTGALHLNSPIVSMVTLPTGTGYWLVAADGGVFSFGGARFYGSLGAKHLNQPIVGGASTADGLGYWLVASDGGVFSFGDATFLGSEGAVHLNQPVVGMSVDPDGGYWLVAADGGVFSFGGAPFFGSTGSLQLVKPIEGISVTEDGEGYRMVASDGGIFDFGDASFFGSEGGKHLNQPIVGMASVGS